MPYKGIIFDKDGTLFDYYDVWAPVFRSSITSILSQLGRSDDRELASSMLRMLGIGDEGINPKGLVFKHNGSYMLMRLFLFSRKHRLHYKKLIKCFMEGYYDSQDLLKDSLESVSSSQLAPLFSDLKAAGYKIGIATSDNRESTDICMQHFQIEQYIDMIATYDDHYKKKPHPDSMRAFCRKFGFSPEEVIVVGDAPVDMKYARRGKAGYIIGVLSGSGDVKSLTRLADTVYEDILSLSRDTTVFPPG